MDDATRTALAEIARRYGLELIVQFGSTVDGPTHARSDLDLAVRRERGRPPLTYVEQADLAHELRPLFPERPLDLALIDHADPLFLKEVLLGPHRLLCGDPRRLAELRLLAFKRYQDHQRFLPLERRYVERIVAAGGRR